MYNKNLEYANLFVFFLPKHNGLRILIKAKFTIRGNAAQRQAASEMYKQRFAYFSLQFGGISQSERRRPKCTIKKNTLTGAFLLFVDVFDMFLADVKDAFKEHQ